MLYSSGERGHVVGEFDAVGDVVSVEALVFERLDPALDDAVGVRGPVPGAHMGQVAAVSEPAGHGDGLHGRAVVGDHDERDDLAGVGVGAVLDEGGGPAAPRRPRRRHGGLRGGLWRPGWR